MNNSNNLGAFCIHSLPVIVGAESYSLRKEKIEKHLKLRPDLLDSDNLFKHFSKFYVYPGMPVMLRANRCLELGLCNGAIGKINSVIGRNINP